MVGMSRRSVVAGMSAGVVSLAAPQLIRAQTEAQPHFFAGCYYDTAISDASLASKFLILPVRNSLNLEKSGVELTPMTKEIVYKHNDFCKYANLNKQEDQGGIAFC